ncbi:AAA family ATPase [Thermodesulfobacteriota bacterium]
MQRNNSPRIVVFFGLVASGKSALARQWAECSGMAYYNSDIIRKELAGLLPKTSRRDSYSQGIYTREFSQKTYNSLLEKAEWDLRQGFSVVLDASYHAQQERRRVRELGERFGATVCFVYCTCSEQETRRRLDLRARDPEAVSDGTWLVYEGMKDNFEEPTELSPDELIHFSTENSLSALIGKLGAELEKRDCRSRDSNIC